MSLAIHRRRKSLWRAGLKWWTARAKPCRPMPSPKARSNSKRPAMSRLKRRMPEMRREAVIVSVARTPIGRAYKGAFNATPAPSLAAHAVRAAVARAKVDPAEIDDCIFGCSLTQGEQQVIGRQTALAAGLPVTVAGQTVERQCSSGLMTIAAGAKQIIVDRMDVVVAGGVESISRVQTQDLRITYDPAVLALHPAFDMLMIDTAEVVS